MKVIPRSLRPRVLSKNYWLRMSQYAAPQNMPIAPRKATMISSTSVSSSWSDAYLRALKMRGARSSRLQDSSSVMSRCD